MTKLKGLLIKPAKLKDFNQLVPLYNQLSENIRTKPNWQNYKVEAKKLQQLKIYKQILKGDSAIIFNAWYKNKIVGSVTIALINNFRHAWVRVHMEEFIVDKNFRQQGVGSEVINYLINYCNKNNIKVIKLMCGRQLTDTHIFYKKLGFKFKDRGYRLEL